MAKLFSLVFANDETDDVHCFTVPFSQPGRTQREKQQLGSPICTTTIEAKCSTDYLASIYKMPTMSHTKYWRNKDK